MLFPKNFDYLFFKKNDIRNENEVLLLNICCS